MRRVGAEYAVAAIVVLLVQVITGLVQERIAAREGRGFDGGEYYAIAKQLREGEALSAAGRFGRRVGTPALAVLADADDLIRGFAIVNVAASFLSSLLLLAWLRLYVATRWVRILLVGLHASHWLQLTRFTFFYPVLVDAWTQVACFGGLLAIAWYQRSPGRAPVLAISAISALGVTFRELVLLVPVAFLFTRTPRLWHQPRFPFLRATHCPRLEQCIPLALAIASLIAVAAIVVPRDPDFSAVEHLGQRALARSAVTFSLGWMVAYAPSLFLVLFDWRAGVRFLSEHPWMLVHLMGVAVIGWVGSLESERHALNWAAPVVLALVGRTVERHLHWFRSPGFVMLLVGAQFLVARLFLTVPQYDENYLQHRPAMLLTPLGGEASYLHLFPNHLPYALLWQSVVEYAVLGMVVLIWTARQEHSRTWGAVSPLGAHQSPSVPDPQTHTPSA